MDGVAWQTTIHGVAKSQKLLINSAQHMMCRLIVSGVLCSPGSSAGKESACNAEDSGSIPGSGRSPGEGMGYYSSILGLPWWLR